MAALLALSILYCSAFFFFFTATATTEIYTLSLHDALPILSGNDYSVDPGAIGQLVDVHTTLTQVTVRRAGRLDRKSTRLNSSHLGISYAVFCLKKKNTRNSGVVFLRQIPT